MQAGNGREWEGKGERGRVLQCFGLSIPEDVSESAVVGGEAHSPYGSVRRRRKKKEKVSFSSNCLLHSTPFTSSRSSPIQSIPITNQTQAKSKNREEEEEKKKKEKNSPQNPHKPLPNHLPLLLLQPPKSPIHQMSPRHQRHNNIHHIPPRHRPLCLPSLIFFTYFFLYPLLPSNQMRQPRRILLGKFLQSNEFG